MSDERPAPDRRSLIADCSSCRGLCCVVPAFGKSVDFAIDKPAGVPCPHLGADHLCTIHTELPERGFAGCTVYDCFGAGQHVVQVLFDGAERSPEMAAAFEVVERLHELLWYLADASDRSLPRGLADEVAGLRERVLTARDEPPDQERATTDVVALQGRVGVVLEEVSLAVRRGLGGSTHRRADLAGRDLREVDLYAADLRGAVLIGADLREVDLGPADLLGADLRGADLRGAVLDEALFLTRLQAASART